jgi:MFS family permease
MAEAQSGATRERGLRREEKVRLALLALPTFALALAITLVSTYLGEITRRYTHQAAVIGAIIGAEGVMALWIPLVAGAWSDQLRTRIGGRLPFVVAGTIPAAVCLALIGFIGSLGGVAAVSALFFAFYFVAYEPYRAMYPDLLEREVAGRAQSSQAIARGVGTALALLGGGLLLSLGRPVPFVFGAIVVVSAVGAFLYLLIGRGIPEQPHEEREGPGQVARRLLRLLREHPALRSYLIANAFWEMALAALKAFVILYLVLGLRFQLTTSSLLVGGVALLILVGAAAAGKAGDRFGRLRVTRFALWAYGVGYLVPIFTTIRPLIAIAVPFIALGGGAVMTLAYAVLIPLMPDEDHGALTGFYSLSRGLGIFSGPILAGALISITGSGPFAATHGFQAMWIVCAAATFASLYFVRRLRSQSEDRRELRGD